MNFVDKLNNKLDELHLLNHCFYQAWNKGELSRETLKTYAKEYYGHVAAFPRYVAGVISESKEIKPRQILLENLVEEDRGEENHPELWKRFAEGLGVDRATLDGEVNFPQTKALVEGYFDLVKSDFATGLGALYAYERQTPKVSESKIDGLKNFYNIHDSRTLQFFEVHMKADEWHSDECAQLIAELTEEEKARAAYGAKKGAKLLLGFLDGMMEEHERNSH